MEKVVHKEKTSFWQCNQYYMHKKEVNLYKNLELLITKCHRI